MAKLKLTSFAEKINAYLKYREYLHFWDQSQFRKKFAQVSEAEGHALIQLGQEIEQVAYDLICQYALDLLLSVETLRSQMRAALLAKYPYLDRIRMDRIISRVMHLAIT